MCARIGAAAGLGAGSSRLCFRWPPRRANHVMIGAVDAANEGSLRFHERMGFERVAEFKEVGHKFGRWLRISSSCSASSMRRAARARARRGPSRQALDHGDMDPGVLGARVAYPIQMNWGTLTPMARLEYSHAFVAVIPRHWAMPILAASRLCAVRHDRHARPLHGRFHATRRNRRRAEPRS